MAKQRKDRRVLIIVENLPVPQDKRVWQEAKSLTAAGYDVAVICPKGHSALSSQEVLEGISIYRHPLPFEGRTGPGFVLEYAWAFVCQFILSWRVWWKHRFNAVQACNPPDNIFLIALPFRLLFGARFLFDQHDGNPELWLAKGGREGGLVHRFLYLLERLSFRSARVALVTNDYFFGIATGRGGKAREDVFQVRNAPNRHLVERTLGGLERVGGEARGSPVVGYLGVIGLQDGVDSFMHVVREVVQSHGRTEVRFRVMGDGPELKHVRALADELGIAGSVEFTGWISGDDYFRGLSGCDVCVNADPANGYNEICSPNKVYEYMLFAKPIVQFDLPEARFIAGDCALYAANNDNADMAARILELIDDPERAREMGRRGRQRLLERFVWDMSEQQLLAAYDRLYA